jgi:hypothetical protein
MESFEPGTGVKSETDPLRDTPDTKLLGSYNLLPNVTTNIWIVATQEKDPRFSNEPITEINEPFYFIIHQERDFEDEYDDSFRTHGHEVHVLPNEFLKNQEFTQYNIESLKFTEAPKRRYCLGCSYQTKSHYTLSKMDTFIRYYNSKYQDYIYCDNCIQKMIDFIAESLSVENYSKEVIVSFS